MNDRMQKLDPAQMTEIHNASMGLLCGTGVVINEKEALSIFRKNGYRVEGKTVFPTEKQILKAIETVPSTFTIEARNPKRNVTIGENNYAFLPGYGAPYIITPYGEQRNATMEDYDTFCKLVHTSRYLDMNGWMMVKPSDMPPSTVHMDMMLSNILLCDKPFMGSPTSREGVLDGIEMAGILWGGKSKIVDKPVSISLISTLSPLQYSDTMMASLIELARNGQACIVNSFIMPGSSRPATLTGVLALQNGEILTGIALSQLVKRGAPVVYGSTSSIMDSTTDDLSIGAPELSKHATFTAQMARFYSIPSRSGGALTDSLYPDAQAGAESALALYSAARAGINVILHACGILGSYTAMSFEKFLIDEEVCGMVRQMLLSTDIGKTCHVQDDKNSTYQKSFKFCQTEHFLPDLMARTNYDGWSTSGKKKIHEIADDLLTQRLAKYEKPDIDPAIEHELTEFVNRRKNGQAF